MNYPPLWDEETEARVRADARNLDEQTAPKEVKFCVRCILSNQRPRITFNDAGVCSACLYAERKRSDINWGERSKALGELLNKHRKSHGYDCIVPCSGGKDSAFVAHTLKHKYNMHPLCINWAPMMMTDIGRKNLDSFIHSGFDVITAAPNGLVHRKLARLGLEYYGDPFLPFIYGQLAWPMNASVDFDIPLVFFGENGEAEYGGDTAANEKPSWDTDDWDRIYKKGVGVGTLYDLGESIGALSGEEITNVSPLYAVPTQEEIDFHDTQFHWLGHYLPWHPMNNFYYASENTGFETNDERSEGTYSKFASIDDKLDGAHYWFGYLKFGLGRCTSDAAQQIRAGDIDRGEGVALVHKYDHEPPTRYMSECLDYLGLDPYHMRNIEDRFRPDHLWERQHPAAVEGLGADEWVLRHRVGNI